MGLGEHHLLNSSITSTKGNIPLENVHGQSNISFVDAPTSELLVRSGCPDANILLAATESLTIDICRIYNLDVVELGFLPLMSFLSAVASFFAQLKNKFWA